MRYLASQKKTLLRLAIAVTYWAVVIVFKWSWVAHSVCVRVCVCVQLKSNLPNNKQLE